MRVEMPVMLSKTYAALTEAGASADSARAASEEIAAFDRRLLRLEIMLGLVLAGVVSLVFEAFG